MKSELNFDYQQLQSANADPSLHLCQKQDPGLRATPEPESSRRRDDFSAPAGIRPGRTGRRRNSCI